MAVSAIPNTARIGFTDVNLGGTEIATQDGSWYYAENISVDMPQGARVIGVGYMNFTAGVFVLPRTNSTIALVSYRSVTLPPSRSVRVFYAY